MSVASTGTEGTDDSSFPAISSDGRYVAFLSTASSLVQDDTNGATDAFVYDRDTGLTTRVSVASGGGQAYADWWRTPAISGDGLNVAFVSTSDALVAGDTNGVEDVFVNGPRIPDLIVQSLSVTPSPTTAGQTTTLTTTISNAGTGTSWRCPVCVWRHRSTPPTATATCDYAHLTTPIVAGDTRTLTDTFTPTYVGSRTAWAYADSGDTMEESNEDNNAGSAAYTIDPTDADLTFQTFTVTPDPVNLGNQATINATVANEGTDPADACAVQLWRHRDAQPVLGTTGDYTHTTSALAPGATETFAQVFTPHYQGGRTAWGIVDSLNIAAENDETNNKASYSYAIQPGTTPDLVASVTATPDPVVLGNSVTLTAGVENTGSVAAGAFDLAAWRHRTDALIVGSPPDYTCAIASLASGASTTSATTFTPGYSGARMAWALADSANAVVENDEVNNIASDAYTIAAGNEPDLVASVTVTPDPLMLGDTATLTVGVQDLGSSGAGAFTLAGWFHRTDAPVIGSPPDASWAISGLAAAGWAERTSTFTPGHAGSRTAWAFADSAEAVLETSESNNITSATYVIAEARGSGGARVPAGAYLCEIVARNEAGQSARAVASVRMGAGTGSGGLADRDRRREHRAVC